MPTEADLPVSPGSVMRAVVGIKWDTGSQPSTRDRSAGAHPPKVADKEQP